MTLPVTIHGIGVDGCHMPRIGASVAKFGDRFLARAFHPNEIARYRSLAASAASAGSPSVKQHQLPVPPAVAFLASRWAAKEALHKALRSHRLLFPEIEVCKLSDASAHGSIESVDHAHEVAPDAKENNHNAVSLRSPQLESTALSMAKSVETMMTNSSGPPGFRFHGAAASTIARLGLAASPPLLSLSHDGQYAVAFVVVLPIAMPLS